MGQILWEIHHGNHEKGMLQLKKLAEQGDAVAQFNYASKYLGAKEYDKAYEWLKKAAAQEMEMAYGQLAHLYHEGLGGNKRLQPSICMVRKRRNCRRCIGTI